MLAPMLCLTGLLMRKIALFMLFQASIPLMAQKEIKSLKKKEQAVETKSVVNIKELPGSGQSNSETQSKPFKEKYELYISFAQGKRLVGYEDPRYISEDKSDYLKSGAMTGNMEFTVKMAQRIKSSTHDSPLQSIFTGTEYLRVGGQIIGWSTLNGSSISIPKTGPPMNGIPVNASLEAATRPGIGFFFGFGGKDFEIDFGLITLLAFEREGNRTRRIIDSNGNDTGNTEEVPGRGLFIANAFVLPTFRLSYGEPNNLQFFISAGRETFEFHKDYLQSYFRIPSADFLSIDVGVGLFPNATLFVQPNVSLSVVTIGLRGGISLNHYTSELKRVSLTDAIYFACSVSSKF